MMKNLLLIYTYTANRNSPGQSDSSVMNSSGYFYVNFISQNNIMYLNFRNFLWLCSFSEHENKEQLRNDGSDTDVHM